MYLIYLSVLVRLKVISDILAWPVRYPPLAKPLTRYWSSIRTATFDTALESPASGLSSADSKYRNVNMAVNMIADVRVMNIKRICLKTVFFCATPFQR
jgi:hypothetical protein